MGRRTGWAFGLLVMLLALMPAAAGGRTQAVFTLTVQVIGVGSVTTSDGAVNCGNGQVLCRVSYTTPVTLTHADVAAGWTFSAWSGDCTSDPCTVPATGTAHVVTANYNGPPTPEKTLSVTYSATAPAGGVVEGGTFVASGGKINDQINCGTTSGQTDCTWSAPLGSMVTITETPTSGSVFTGWGGTCGGTSDSCTVSLVADQTANASWATAGSSFPLTVAIIGGGFVTGNGIACPPTCTANEPAGSTVTLTATPDAGAGYSFSSWTAGPCSGSTVPTCAVNMTKAQDVTATFIKKMVLTVSVSGNGNVSGGNGAINCGNGGNTCSASYKEGDSVTLVATAATGATFVGWTGACGGSSGNCTIAMNQSKSVTATFTGGSAGASFTLSATVTGSGTVTGGGLSCPGTCTANETPSSSVVLTATPASGATFTSWGGACSSSGSSATCTVTMDAAKSVSATFSGGTPPGLLLRVIVSGDGTVTGGGISCGHGQPRCTATLSQNATVTLTATPVAGGTFKGWSGVCTGTAKTCNVTMNAAKTVSASFSTSAPASMTLTISVAGPGTVSTSAGKCTSTAGKKRTCAQKFAKGAKAVLTEAPAKGQKFVAWGGACKVKTASCTVVMTAPRSVSATFSGAGTTKPPPKSTLKSLHAPIVRKAQSGYTVTLQFQTAVGGVAHVRGLRAGRLLSTLALKVAAGRATIGPFPVAKPGLYSFQVQLGKQQISWPACLGGCGPSARAPAFVVEREAPTATHTGDVWSVTLHVRANFISVARVRAYRGTKLLVDRRFLGHSGKIAVGPFLLGPGKYTLRFDATDPYGRAKHLVWIVALAQ